MAVTLVNRVRALSQSTSDVTPNSEVVDFLCQSTKQVLYNLPIHVLFPFASSRAGVTSSTGIRVVDGQKIVYLTRNGITCDEVPLSMAYDVGSSDSWYYATARYPRYYVRGNTIFVKPDPTTAAVAVLYEVDLENYGSTNHITSAVTNTWSLKPIDAPIITYAASKDIFAQGMNLRKKASSLLSALATKVTSALSNFSASLTTWITTDVSLPTDFAISDYTAIAMDSTTLSLSYTNVEDALTKAQSLIDNLGATDFESFLTDEDPEMATVTVQGAANEVNRAREEISKETLKLSNYVQNIQQNVHKWNADVQKWRLHLDQEIGQTNVDVEKFAANVQKETNRVNAALKEASLYLQEARVTVDRFREVEQFFNGSRIMVESSMALSDRAEREVRALVGIVQPAERREE